MYTHHDPWNGDRVVGCICTGLAIMLVVVIGLLLAAPLLLR